MTTSIRASTSFVNSQSEEDDWCIVDLSKIQQEAGKAQSVKARAENVHTYVLQPLAFVLCANSPSLRLAVLGIAGLGLLKPAVVEATARCITIFERRI